MNRKPRLRILMLIPQLGYGGAEGAFLRVAHYLAGHADVTIALMARDYGTGGTYSTAGTGTELPVILLDGERAPGRGPFAKALRWWRMWRRLRQLKYEYDVTISFLSGTNLLNALAGRRDRTIISERGSKRHDTGRSTLNHRIWTYALDPLAYRGAAVIVAASEGLAGEISQHHPSIANRIRTIEGTIHAESLVAQADMPLDADIVDIANMSTRPLVAAFGRLHHQKGFDFLLSTMAQVRRDLPEAGLLLIGDGPEADHLAIMAEDLGLRLGSGENWHDCDVIMAGYRQKPSRYLSFCRVVALPSRYEGLPNALIEAVASGIPVLAADCPWGPRSVLAASPEPLAEPQPVARPLRLPHGTLMPLPDRAEAQEIWAQEIVTALQHQPVRRPREERLAAIRRFDIAETGPVWLRLCKELSAKGSGNEDLCT